MVEFGEKKRLEKLASIKIMVKRLKEVDKAESNRRMAKTAKNNV